VNALLISSEDEGKYKPLQSHLERLEAVNIPVERLLQVVPTTTRTPRLTLRFEDFGVLGT
jgi:hypothetical protein